MAQYIDKSAVVAEIEKRVNSLNKDRDFNYLQIKELEALLSSLDTIEVKDVNLEKETKKWWKERLHLNPESQLWMDAHQSIVFAEHFFELGMCVNNPITAADRGMAEEIIVNLKRIEKDYHIDLTREMEWVRNKT